MNMMMYHYGNFDIDPTLFASWLWFNHNMTFTEWRTLEDSRYNGFEIKDDLFYDYIQECIDSNFRE